MIIPGTSCSEHKLKNSIKLITLDIHELSVDLIEYVNELLVSICTGDSGTSLEVAKADLLEFLNRKNDSTTRMGAVAEFFVHLVLNSFGYKQECLFENLEENSIKKGFDGYYSKADVEWIMESKSGMSDTKGMCHASKVKEAYTDLCDKISGNTTNNPWKNAYHHARSLDVNTNDTIVKNIKRMADNFTLKKYDHISNFNIIPAATIFYCDEWEDVDIKKIIIDVEKCISKFKYKDILVICMTKYSVEILQEILRS